VSASSKAVFLSYASEDASAAQRIADALRAAGIDVWFDRAELRGGDSWDRRIRQQIHECRLFVPIVSADTEARTEGYFRREWSLAVDRTHDLSQRVAFLVPVVIDSTSELTADVPEAFRRVQWTRLPDGGPTPAFVERIKRLLTPEASAARATSVMSESPAARASEGSGRQTWRRSSAYWTVGGLLALILAYFAIDKLSTLGRVSVVQAPTGAGPQASSGESAPPSSAATFNPPPHSIAVLPFVNMSGDKAQEYFSDGMSEELLNALARLTELQVAARTSSFYFKGKDVDLNTIARKLNVASVLEGSVRRSGQTIRVTAQLNNAATGYHLWSQTYDRDASNVLQVQTEIANAVVEALKVTLLGSVSEKIGVGGTRNPAAFDAYLRASTKFSMYQSAADHQTSIDGYTEAIHLDPKFALAYADRSFALGEYAAYWATGSAVRSDLVNAEADARKAVALAPDLAEGHLALASVLTRNVDFKGAAREFQRALELAPGDARVLVEYGDFSADMDNRDAALTAMQRAVVLDPLNPQYHIRLGGVLYAAGRYDDAMRAYEDGAALAQNDALLRAQANMWIALVHYSRGNFQEALIACDGADEVNKPICLALVYDKLGRHADGEHALAKFRAAIGDDGAVFYSMIYAQWGDIDQALHWLEVAMRRKDPFLRYVKAYPLLEPIRGQQRFQAIERALAFPD
jgi:TolB-like protein/Flp pilus assembly protein TadD